MRLAEPSADATVDQPTVAECLMVAANRLPRPTTRERIDPPESLPASAAGYSASVALAPDPFDAEIEALMADPAFRREFDEFDDRDASGDVQWHDESEAREVLRRHGIPLLDDAPQHDPG